MKHPKCSHVFEKDGRFFFAYDNNDETSASKCVQVSESFFYAFLAEFAHSPCFEASLDENGTLEMVDDLVLLAPAFGDDEDY